MDTIRKLLDKVDELLTTEPARMIAYGAAVVVFLVVQIIGHFRPGLLPAVSFDEAVGLTISAVAALVVLVESIRRAVYSPQTFIEELADQAMRSYQAGHVDAHEEEAQAREAEAAQPQKVRVPVGVVTQSGNLN